MKKKESIAMYEQFEKLIASFIENPKNYQLKYNGRLMRQAYNASLGYVAWLIAALFVNFAAISFFDNAVDKAEVSSLITISCLFLTIGSRSYTVNYLLFHTIGRLGKLNRIHEIGNRVGFFHRFMALSTLLWLVVHLQHREFKAPFVDEAFLLLLLLFVVLIMVVAVSSIRRKNHNSFENIHRYIGYTSMLLLVGYFTINHFQDHLSYTDLLANPSLYLLVGIAIMLISPWIGVKRIHPELVHVGPHVIGIKIEGGPSFGTYSRITLANGYFHPFGDSMYDFDDMENRTLYMTPAGDRTSEIVGEAQNDNFLLDTITIKSDRNRGFMYHHSVYDHILIIVTGGGIAPIVPCLVLNKNTKIDVLWLGKSHEEEFTPELLTKLLGKIEDQDIGIHIIDTKSNEMEGFTNETYIALMLEAYGHYKPEAVFVMSNQEFTIDAMCALNENDIPCYGATFDS